MRPVSRVLAVVASLLLAVLYVQPMWRIDLRAPQYPEGLGLRIWINQIRGAAPHQLESINGLNHYIGMAPIVPDQIPELRYMPYIVGGLIGLGLLVAALGRRKLLYTWLALLMVLAVAGLYDFWKWEYDYGHNLDPTAAIRIPGMSYQPPLIGGQKLLNFYAASWPDVGGWAAIIAVTMVVLVTLHEWRRARQAGVVLLAALAACAGPAPREIHFGAEECAHCHMRIVAPQFAAELVTKTGKVYVFDDVGCMLDFITGGTVPLADIHSTWAMDYHNPGTLHHRDKLEFVHAEGVRTPMGSGMIAQLKAGRADRAVRADTIAQATVSSLEERIAGARRGERIVLPAGTYRIDREVQVAVPLELVGEGMPVIEGTGSHGLLRVMADSVTIRGITFRNVATSYMEDRAAVRFDSVTACAVVDSRFEDTFFGVYLAGSNNCEIRGNTFRGTGGNETRSGNAIHLWTTTGTTIADNDISGHRDGIYLEFARHVMVRHNKSSRNHRYGLHFMLSDSSDYVDNSFSSNSAGIAVMYTKHVTMRGNRFADHWGAGDYGLMLKGISDGILEDNTFSGNSTALFLEGANRLTLRDNTFERNGWAIRLLGNSEENRFSGNRFQGNSFDVATNSKAQSNRFDGNAWDQYRGYDLNGDGIGDVPHPPVRLFSLLVQQDESSLILLRSLLVDLLEMAERVMPVLTPTALEDPHPVMAS